MLTAASCPISANVQMSDRQTGPVLLNHRARVGLGDRLTAGHAKDPLLSRCGVISGVAGIS